MLGYFERKIKRTGNKWKRHLQDRKAEVWTEFMGMMSILGVMEKLKNNLSPIDCYNISVHIFFLIEGVLQ